MAGERREWMTEGTLWSSASQVTHRENSPPVGGSGPEDGLLEPQDQRD